MFPIISVGQFSVPTYLLILSFVYTLSVFYVFQRAAKFDLNRVIALDFCMLIMIFGLLGARAMHVLYEQPRYYLNHPLQIFQLWQGGFVYYGGAIAAFIASWFYAKKRSLNFLEWLDLFAPVISLAYALGRLACLAAGCCFGRECNLPWSIVYPEGVEAPAHVHVHPAPIYASLWELMVFIILLRVAKKYHSTGKVFWLWLSLHSLGRILMELFRGDDRGTMFIGVSISTLISVIIFIFSTRQFIRKQTST